MKLGQVILLVSALLFSGIVYYSLKQNKKEYKKETKAEAEIIYVPISKVKNSEHLMQIASYGQINPVTEVAVSLEFKECFWQEKKAQN